MSARHYLIASLSAAAFSSSICAHATECTEPPPPAASGSTLATTMFRNNGGVPPLNQALTIRFADVDGDGADDVCGHDGTSVVCQTHVFDACTYGADGTATCPSFDMCPSYAARFGDVTLRAEGFNQSWLPNDAYWRTIAFPDVNGDGLHDVCGRGANGIFCALSNGDDFGNATLWSSNFRNLDGWDSHQGYWSTIDFPDVNGDGKADVCGRGSAGVFCQYSTGAVFSGTTPPVTTFSDANGWKANAAYFSTIQFGDIDGDGDDDVCGRWSTGVWCAKSRPITRDFAPAQLWTTQFNDANGWDADEYFATIQLADVNGDGAADICGRGSMGIHCGISYGGSGQALFYGADGPPKVAYFTDAGEWSVDNHFRTIRVVDVNGDGNADVCGRGAEGIQCALAKSWWEGATSGWTSLFHPVSLRTAQFTDEAGWDDSMGFWGTVQPANVVNGPFQLDGGVEFCGRGTEGILCSHR